MSALPSAPKLRAAVVMDYQNVHLTGANLFRPNLPLHETLISPGSFARNLIEERNNRQREGNPLARVCSVRVFRGLPHPDDDQRSYAFNQAHQSEWEKDALVRVTHRPLRYEYEYDGTGRFATDIRGRRIVKSKREKGIDVLCALAILSEARRPDIDLVILASQDTDLEPAVEEATLAGAAKIETCSWFSSNGYRTSREIRPTPKVWNTRLGESRFNNSIDRVVY